MRPLFDHCEQFFARAFGSPHLSVADQLVVDVNVFQINAAPYECVECADCRIGWNARHEVSNEYDAVWFAVDARCVCARLAPSATFVHTSIAADKEIVADVTPLIRVYVLPLNASCLLWARLTIDAHDAGRVVCHHKWGRISRELRYRPTGRLSTPFAATHNPRAPCDSSTKFAFAKSKNVLFEFDVWRMLLPSAHDWATAIATTSTPTIVAFGRWLLYFIFESKAKFWKQKSWTELIKTPHIHVELWPVLENIGSTAWNLLSAAIIHAKNTFIKKLHDVKMGVFEHSTDCRLSIF